MCYGGRTENTEYVSELLAEKKKAGQECGSRDPPQKLASAAEALSCSCANAKRSSSRICDRKPRRALALVDPVFFALFRMILTALFSIFMTNYSYMHERL
jgi:hypothetical protein